MITPVPKLRSTPRVVGQLALLVISACLIAAVLSGVAHADLDSYSTGDGHEGAVTVSTNSVLNYSAPINAAVSAGATSLTTAAGQTGATGATSTTGSAAQTQFEANRLALVIQSTNYSGPGATSGSQADIDLSSNAVGRWELARISSVTGSIAAGMTVNFSSPLINSYSSSGAQIVAVPEFTTVQVNSARTWSANPWNGSNGGITAFLANGAVNMSASTSTITADGAGFRGGVAYNTGGSGCTQLDGTGGGGKGEGIVSGVYPGTSATYASRGNIANAGGGGDCENAGGGGGGNGGTGGKGGYAYDGNRDVGGYGGAKLTYSAFDHAVFGGGGGAGDANNNVAGPGGNGGGLVFMRAASLTGSGTISAVGAAGGNSANVGASDGAGGGGAGGVVYARFTGAASCTLVSAKGGAGGNEQSTSGVHGPGGGGAGGRLVLQSASGTCPTNIGNGVAGTTTGSGNSNRGSGPTSATDSTSSGATEAVSGGGGMSAPTAAVSTPADGAHLNSATPTITGTSSMSLGTVRITIDGAYVGAATTLVNGNWTFATSTLTAGSHTYSIQPVYYGIAGAASSNRTLIVDTTAPSAPTVTSNRSGSVNVNTATITYTAAEGGGTMQCSPDGTTYTTCSASPVSLTGLTDGVKAYYVRQLDAAGNVGAASSVTWTVDTVAPAAPTVSSNRSGTTSQTTATITYAAAEGGGTMQCSTDGTTYTTCAPSPVSLTGLSDGVKTFFVRQVDVAGNEGSVNSVTWTVDTAAPLAPTVVSNRSGSTNQTTATITYTAAELGGTLECSSDGTTYSNCAASPIALSGLNDGAKSYFVRQVDAAGNVGGVASVAWIVDTIDPLVVIDSPIDRPFSNTAVQEIEFSASDENLASTECSIDGGAFTPCVSTWVTPALGDGFHMLRVRATDEAGQASVASYEVTVDTVIPADPVISQPTDGAHLNNPRPTVSGTAEPGALVKIFVDSLNVYSVHADGSGAWSWTPNSDLSDGPHTLAATASDAAENTSPGLNTLTVTIDTIAPGVPTLTGPSAHSNNPESTVTFSASSGTDSLMCSFNGASPAACPSSPLSLGELPDGNYTFTVTAHDNAGNSSSNTLAWEIDTAAPAAPTITGGPIGQIASTSASFDFTGAEAGGTFKCQLDSAPAVTCTSPFDYVGLADGSYTFHVRQVDAAGNVSPEDTRTWTVDTTPPPTPVVSGPTSPSGFTSATITFSNTEAGVTFQCSVDGATAQPCTSPLALSSLADGTHSVEVRAYDAAGNGSAPETVTWDVDQSLFTADISGAPTGVVNTTSAALSLTATLPGSTFECSLDGAAFAACAATVNLSSLTEGEHTFWARAKNGPQTSAAVSRSWTVDLTNPSVGISSPLPGETTASEVDVSFSVTDANDVTSLTCKLDSGSASPCTSPLQLSDLANGEHTLTIVATDAGGNANSAAVTWSVDDIAPAGPAILQPAANAFISDTTPLFVGTAEPNSTVRLYDGATLVATVTADGDGDWEWAATPPLSEGAHVFSATATDAYDNTSAHSPNRTITIDTENPDAPTIDAPSSGPINDATPLVTGLAEPFSTVHVYVDGDLVGQSPVAGDGSWSLNLTPALSDGNHAITAVTEDAAGNRSPDSDELLVEVDTAAPSVAITTPSANTHVGTASPEVSFSAESGAATRCKLDDGSFDSCASPVLLSGLSEGIHTYTVEATDAAGNAATAVRTFTVDLTAPTASISGGPTDGSQSNDETPTFTLASNESGSFECSVDGGAYAPCTSPFSPTLGSPLDGPHTISVRAIDDAGNPSSAQTRSWTVDTQAPDAPAIDDPADNTAVQDTTPTIAGDPGSAEAGSSVDVYIDGTFSGTATAAGDGSWAYTPSSALNDNVYTFTAKARDAAGNTSAASNAVHVRVDASSPTAQITGKPSALTNSSQATFNFTADEPATFECRVDSGAFGACSAPTLLSGLVDGEHTFFVRATDAGSNTSPSEQWTWTIDTTPPVVTVSANSPAAGLSPTFSFISNESGTTYKCRIDGSGVFATCSSPFNAPTLGAGSHTLELQFTDAAGNTGSKNVAFSVSDAPITENPPNPGGGESATQVCTGDGDEPGVPANLSVISATAKKNTVKFTTTSDKYILVRVSIYDGKKLVGTAVRANNTGKRIVAIKTKKALPKNKKFSIRLSAVTMTGGKSVADAQLATDGTGNATLLGANGQAGGNISGVVECAAEKGAKKVKVKVATALKVKATVKNLTASAQATDYAVATFRVVQNGNTVARRVFLLKPNKKLKASLKLLPGKKLAKGSATVQISTCSVDGIWQVSKKQVTVN